jgi:predicted Zn-dependent peptidase
MATAANGELRVTQMDNGVVVASTDAPGQVATVSIAVRAGSRNETAANAGVSHYIRNLAFQSTANRTALRIAREAEDKGIQYSVTSGRDHTVYNSVSMKGDASYAANVLADTIAAPKVEAWEVPRQNFRVGHDIAVAQQNDGFALLDDAYRGAFRTQSLGRSAICAADRVGSISASDVQDFRANFFTGDRTVVAGYGVDYDSLVTAVQQLGALGDQGANDVASQYFGGEVIISTNSNVGHVFLGFEGVSASSEDAMSALVLSQLLGGQGSALKWATDATASKVGAAVGAAVNGQFGVSASSTNYTDTGLIGVHLAIAGEDVAKGTSAAAAAVKDILGGNITEEDVNAAKAKLRLQVLADDRASVVQDIASQLVYTGAYDDAAAQLASLNSVSVDQVKKVAAKLAGSKAVLAARGAVDDVPTLAALGF